MEAAGRLSGQLTFWVAVPYQRMPSAVSSVYLSTADAPVLIVGAVLPAHRTVGLVRPGESACGQVTAYGPPDAAWVITMMTRCGSRGSHLS